MTVVFGRGSQEYKDAFARKLVPVGAYVKIGRGKEESCPSFKALYDGNLGYQERCDSEIISGFPEIVIRDELWRVVISKMPSYEQGREDQSNGRKQFD